LGAWAHLRSPAGAIVRLGRAIKLNLAAMCQLPAASATALPEAIDAPRLR